MVHVSLQADFAAALLANHLPPVCFRVVSWVPQNGFVRRGGEGRVRWRPRALRRAAVRRKLAFTETRKMKITRRALLGSASAAWATSILSKPASAAAEFEFKLGVNTPDTHPLTVRLTEADPS